MSDTNERAASSDDVALPELTAEQKEQCAEVCMREWDMMPAVYRAMQEGIAIGLADRARASERSTAEPVAWQCREKRPGNGGWFECPVTTYLQCLIDPRWESRALYASPPASDAALERAALVSAVQSLIGYCEGVFGVLVMEDPKRFESTMQGFHERQDRLDSLMQSTATDETGGRG